MICLAIAKSPPWRGFRGGFSFELGFKLSPVVFFGKNCKVQ